LADGFAACSSFLGTVTLGELTNGNYRLFAKPQSASYGMQWVGATGGTGDERQAVVIPATLGTVAAAPQIRIDRTGSIAGTVTDAETGAPIVNARVAPFSQQPGQGAPETLTDEHGRYQVDGLGPYAWPLKFAAIGSAQAWTGGAATRYTATPTQVTAGATATADLALRDGVEVAGSVRTESGAAISGFVSVRNADTGDYAGSDDVSDGRFSVRVLPGTRIYFSYTLSEDGVSHNVDRVPGDIVRVPATGLTAEIVVPGA
jgi:hypothetical protein